MTPTASSRRVMQVIACSLCALALAACTGTTEISGLATPTSATVATSPADRTEPTPEASAPPQAIPNPEPTSSPLPTTADQELGQVLLVTELIPRGTSINELLETPLVYLSAAEIPEAFRSANAIRSMAELAELKGFVLTADALPGEQLLRTRFKDPRDFATVDPNPETIVAMIATPPGHEAQELVLPPKRAVSGFIRGGELVRVIATSQRADGLRVATTLIDAVEVLNVETKFAVDGADPAAPANFGVTIAMEPDEAAALNAALAESAIITLAADSPTGDGYAVTVEMTQSKALDGEVRMGDIVNIASVADLGSRAPTEALVASNVEVLQVSADGDLTSADTTFSLIVAVDAEQLVAITAAAANAQVWLTVD